MAKRAQKTRVYFGDTDITSQVLEAALHRAAGEIEHVQLTLAVDYLSVGEEGELLIYIENPEEEG